MLLKKILYYKKHQIIFTRIKLPTILRRREDVLRVCKLCNFYKENESCELKYLRNIKIEILKCGLDFYRYNAGLVSYGYIKKGS